MNLTAINILFLLVLLTSCDNKNETSEEVHEKISGDYVFLSYWDRHNTFKVEDCIKYCKKNNCDICEEIQQIDSLIGELVRCIGGVNIENERYIDSYDKSCVKYIVSRQILDENNKLNIEILEKIYNMYLHEAVSVLSIYYYHSYYRLADLHNTTGRDPN